MDNASFSEMLAVFFPIVLRLPFPRLIEVGKARNEILREATKLVQMKQNEKAIGKDILSLMIAENLKAEAEGKLGEMELVDQVRTFLLAGHETTSMAVRFRAMNLIVGYMGTPSSCSEPGNSRTLAFRGQASQQSHHGRNRIMSISQQRMQRSPKIYPARCPHM
jgi:Cytochrome P450